MLHNGYGIQLRLREFDIQRKLLDLPPKRTSRLWNDGMTPPCRDSVGVMIESCW